MEARLEEGRPRSPVRIDGSLDPDLSRWLWLVKWLLAIPHYVMLLFLWLAFGALTVVAFFAILVTGRYPRGLFEFNVGVLRWTWRVAFYTWGALGTDRYPPFTLADVHDYPARLEVTYPERLSRGLVLVKWWLLAIPHYVVVGVLLGSAGYAGSRVEDWAWVFGFQGGLVGILVFFAGVSLLFTTRYPRGIFDLVLGLDRWVARVIVYAGLMTDAYPPFRLDQGGADPARTEEPPLPPPVSESPETTPEPAPRRGGGVGRIVLVVLGTVAAFFAFAALVGGCALVAVDQIQRDDDGFLMSPSEDFATATYAVVSENADITTEGAEWALEGFLGTVRIRSESDEREVFVGIAPEADVNAYLEGVEHDVVTDLEDEPRYEREPGDAPAGPPADEAFWVASSSGAGELTIDWEPEDGDWRIVLMNADASRGVASELSIGAELGAVVWIGIGFLVAGALLAAGAALWITAGLRRR